MSHKSKHSDTSNIDNSSSNSTRKSGVFRRNKKNKSHTKNNNKDHQSPKPSSHPAMMDSPTLSDISDDGTEIRRPDISIERALLNAARSDEQDLQSIKDKSRLAESEHLRRLYSDPENLSTLESGGCIFSFVCNHELSKYEASMVDAIINLSGFEDEVAENGVPHFEYAEYEEQHRLAEAADRSSWHSKSPSSSSQSSLSSRSAKHPKYTFLLARCGYLLTGFSLEELLADPQIITSLDYQKACQPAGTEIWDDFDRMDADNFRISKPIIPKVYKFTVQFRVSRVQDENELRHLSEVLHIPVDGAIVLERTKRSKPPKEDATRKIKSVLIYTDLGSGVVLVTHLTIMLQMGLPWVIEGFLGKIGRWGLGETAETAWRTRKYLQAKLPYASPSFLDALPHEELKSTLTEKTVEHKDSSSDDDDDFFDAVDDSSEAQDLALGVANLTVH
jgi:hypothetical protein